MYTRSRVVLLFFNVLVFIMPPTPVLLNTLGKIYRVFRYRRYNMCFRLDQKTDRL